MNSTIIKNTLPKPQLVIRNLGKLPYQQTWDKMRDFNTARSDETADEIWILEHPPVYTLGLNNKSLPPLKTNIDIVQSDRGGQITYHGPGQLIIYTLLDLHRLDIGIKRLVELLEDSVIQLLSSNNIKAHRIPGAPGVYIDKQKLAALGLRVKKQSCYHGLSINIDMDLGPFSDIDPCGYKDMEVIDLKGLGLQLSAEDVAQDLLGYLTAQLGYTLPTEPYPSELP